MVLISTSLGGGGGTDPFSPAGIPYALGEGGGVGIGGGGGETIGLLPIGGLLGVAGGG